MKIFNFYNINSQKDCKKKLQKQEWVVSVNETAIIRDVAVQDKKVNAIVIAYASKKDFAIKFF